MKILFVNDCNSNELEDPRADLIEVYETVTKSELEALEESQPGIGRLGGNWMKIMENFDHKLISSGRLSNYTDDQYDLFYKVVSGNY